MHQDMVAHLHVPFVEDGFPGGQPDHRKRSGLHEVQAFRFPGHVCAMDNLVFRIAARITRITAVDVPDFVPDFDPVNRITGLLDHANSINTKDCQ
ncbi:hypothetical protein D3C71_1562360 [compost metagenome]